VRASLQVGQIALSLVLLFTAGLFVRSLKDIQRLDLGYDRERVLAVDVSFPRPDSATKDALASRVLAEQARYEDLRARFERVPGVARASIAFASPLSAVIILAVRVPGRDSLPAASGGRPLVTSAGPRYFETVGTRILRGRGFVAADAADIVPVVILNKTMAELIWPGADAIGRCIMLSAAPDAPCARVVGVVQDVHHMSLKEPALAQCYIPWGQDKRFVDGSLLLVRARGEARALVPALKTVLRSTVPGLRSVDIETLEQVLDPQIRPWRVAATLFGLFGTIVITVAAIGLFSVVSYLVTQRTHELGVRIALGAQRGHILTHTMGSGLRTAAMGIVAGGALSLAIAPLVQPLLFDNGARDPVLLGVLGAGLLGVSAAASLWPSWRATRVDPLIALRAE
jgi:predicted permease